MTFVYVQRYLPVTVFILFEALAPVHFLIVLLLIPIKRCMICCLELKGPTHRNRVYCDLAVLRKTQCRGY